MHQSSHCLLLLTLLNSSWLFAQSENQDWKVGQPPKIAPGTLNVVQCPEPLPSSSFRADQRTEKFSIYIPKGYDPNDTLTKYGLIVYVNPVDASIASAPEGWGPVLDQHKIFLVAPSNVGNNKPDTRRLGMALLSTALMQKYYSTIDPSKIYVSGLSGGARIASVLGLNHPNIFHGTIQSCGTNFYKAVPRLAITDKDLESMKNRDKDGPYGLCICSSPNQSKDKVKFVLITGPGDFRHNYILDIYHGGYEAEGFKAKLIDVPGMGHQLCSGQTLDEALTFIETPDS